MNVTTNKKPLISAHTFKGLFNRGPYETCPPDHLTECNNCVFPSSSAPTIREPVTITSRIPGRQIISYFVSQAAGGSASLLTLNTNGDFYNETVGPTLLHTEPLANDFAAINIYGRTYISFKKNGKAVPGSILYYFDGLNFAPAAHLAPLTKPIVSTLAAGSIDFGKHQFAVSYETRTGFVSPPSPLSTAVSFDGTTGAHITFPAAPSDVVAWILLATKANQEELFFVPEGRFLTGSPTRTFDVDFFDTSLISSADYLNDVFPTLPSCSALRFYKGRLILIGQDETPDIILASEIDDPETFSFKSQINIPQDRGMNTANTGAIIRDILYIMKPNGTYSTQDNGNDPNTWPVTIIDSGIGCWDNGLSVFESSMSGQDVFDSCFLLNQRGLLLFDGSFSAIPFTYKIQNLWNIIDKNALIHMHLAHDVWNKRIYISVPLFPPTDDKLTFTSTAPSNPKCVILMMDYQDGLDPNAVKWSTWTSQIFNAAIRKLSMENFTLVYDFDEDLQDIPVYQLTFCTTGDTIYKIVVLDPTILGLNVQKKYYADLSGTGAYPIDQYICLPVMTDFGVYVFTCIDLSIFGEGNLNLTLFSKNRARKQDLRTFNLTAYSQSNIQNLQRLINFTSENMQILLRTKYLLPGDQNTFFQVNMINVFGNKQYIMRPALQQSF